MKYDALIYHYLIVMKKIFSPRSVRLLHQQQSSFSELEKFNKSFLSPANLNYIENLYQQWLVDKDAVSPSFAAYFELLEKGKDPH